MGITIDILSLKYNYLTSVFFLIFLLQILIKSFVENEYNKVLLDIMIR